jgi:hypothetical protein
MIARAGGFERGDTRGNADLFGFIRGYSVSASDQYTDIAGAVASEARKR